MAAEAPSPAASQSRPTRGGRGGRGRGGFRGRGGGRGGKARATTTKDYKVVPRGIFNSRGRVKTFVQSRPQASFDRNRNIKDSFRVLCKSVKPALEELANRTIKRLQGRKDAYKDYDETSEVEAALDSRLAEVQQQEKIRLELGLNMAKRRLHAEETVANLQYQNGVEEMYEECYDGMLERLRMLEAQHAKGLPVDIRDDRYEYKVISDEHLDNEFGVYNEYDKDGNLVPYPARVEGTKRYKLGQQSQEDAKADKAAKAAALKEKNNTGTRGRGAPKRKAQDQPEDAPTPKKATRTSARLAAAGLSETGPAKGLLAADEEASAPFGTETPDAEDSTPGSPEPEEEPAQDVTEGRFLPKSATDADEHGLRSCEWRHDGVNVIHNRFILPPYYKFGDWEIGFSDSRNSKEHQRKKQAAANPFTGNPNSGAWYFDHRVVDYDSSQLTARSLDQETVAKHGLHPTTGLFLADSKNDKEPAGSYVMPGKPVVYIANPSGRISHASRSFQVTTTQRSVEEAPARSEMRSALHKFCKKNDIGPEDMDLTGYVLTDEELRAKSLGTAEPDDRTQSQSEETTSDNENVAEPSAQEAPQATEAGGVTSLSILTYALATHCAEEESSRPTPAVTKTSRYDAIRDVFTSSKPEPAPAPVSGSLGMNMLAQICNIEPPMTDATRNTNHAALAAIIAPRQPTQATAEVGVIAGAEAPEQTQGQEFATRYPQQHEAAPTTLAPPQEHQVQHVGPALPHPVQQMDRGVMAPVMQQDRGIAPGQQVQQQDRGMMQQMLPQDSGMVAPMHQQESRIMPHQAVQHAGAMMPHPDARHAEYVQQQPSHHSGHTLQDQDQHYRAASFSHPDHRESPYASNQSIHSSQAAELPTKTQYKSVRFAEPVVPPHISLRQTETNPRPDANMVAAAVPSSPSFNPEGVTMYGFGAIPTMSTGGQAASSAAAADAATRAEQAHAQTPAPAAMPKKIRIKIVTKASKQSTAEETTAPATTTAATTAAKPKRARKGKTPQPDEAAPAAPPTKSRKRKAAAESDEAAPAAPPTKAKKRKTAAQSDDESAPATAPTKPKETTAFQCDESAPAAPTKPKKTKVTECDESAPTALPAKAKTTKASQADEPTPAASTKPKKTKATASDESAPAALPTKSKKAKAAQADEPAPAAPAKPMKRKAAECEDSAPVDPPTLPKKRKIVLKKTAAAGQPKNTDTNNSPATSTSTVASNAADAAAAPGVTAASDAAAAQTIAFAFNQAPAGSETAASAGEGPKRRTRSTKAKTAVSKK
ncbi:ATP-dependent DNA helicase PIF1 [Purpureocillium lavendulum]|uniref:ATP-dependent DNA helicase PIF1 n=1 Tax=Purpureocillium lavendulum TaxID=1247861 RepID=A0AB34G067_9HYPO|nr:ATP-dependent DNA helicase PIF1 [Purpureocillium lavendulum]